MFFYEFVLNKMTLNTFFTFYFGIQGGTKITNAVSDKVDSTPSRLQKFQVIVEKVQETLPLIYAMETFVDIITRSSFCAYQQNNTEYYELTQKFIRILSSKIKISTGFIVDMENPLKPLDRFKADIKKYLLNPINGFKDILDPLFDIIKALNFLQKIAEWKLKIPVCPKIKFGGPFPWVDISFKPCEFGLEEIGDFVQVRVHNIYIFVSQVLFFVSYPPCIGSEHRECNQKHSSCW